MFHGQMPRTADELLSSRSVTTSEPCHNPQHSRWLQEKNSLSLPSAGLHVNHNWRTKSNFLPGDKGCSVPRVLTQSLLPRLIT